MRNSQDNLNPVSPCPSIRQVGKISHWKIEAHTNATTNAYAAKIQLALTRLRIKSRAAKSDTDCTIRAAIQN